MSHLRVDRIVLHRLRMPLRFRFETSFGVETDRLMDLVEMHADGMIGWGENVASEQPSYSEETVAGERLVLRQFLIPELLAGDLAGAADVSRRLAHVRGHFMAKAALDCAAYDLEAKRRGMPLSRLLGGTRHEVAVGVSLGIESSPEQVVAGVEEQLAAGARRVKLKVKPGFDEGTLDAVRGRFPDIPLSVDANAAYTGEDVERLAGWSRYHLEYVEQPFPEDDLILHAKLHKAAPDLRICLDESIRSAAVLETALTVGACQVVNLKIGRVGGLTESLRIASLCARRNIDLWCGGMLETGIGRLANVAITSLAAFTLPGDTQGSDRYWLEDLIDPPVEVKDGVICVPDRPGLGHDVLLQRVAQYEVEPPEVFTAG